MRIPHRHLSRREAERLLDAPAGDGSALGQVLAAAGGPAQPGELGREDATAATFQRTATVPSPSSGPVIVPAPRRGARAAVRAVVATGAVVALATGGFALAGSADLPHIPGLPDLPGRASDRATAPATDRTTDGSTESVDPEPTTSATSSTSTPEDEATATGGAGPSESGKPQSPTASATTSPSTSAPTTSLEDLCRAFQAAGPSPTAPPLDSAALAVLVAEAGSPEQVAAYCVDLIGPPTVKPTPTSKPTGKATDKPTDKPSPTDEGGGTTP